MTCQHCGAALAHGEACQSCYWYVIDPRQGRRDWRDLRVQHWLMILATFAAVLFAFYLAGAFG